MSLFVNTSNLHNLLLECSNLNISDTIERDCLSVLHKLHDQVNGLQLVQVVVQPLARLFNPASLAALASSSQLNKSSSPITTTATTSGANSRATSSQNASAPHSNASTPSSHYPPTHFGQQQQYHHHHHQLHQNSNSSNNDLESHNHSRSQSFASTISAGNQSTSATNINNNSLNSTMSTYMMSPDTAQALIARLDTDRDVNWLMEIIGYGLSMPFSITGEQDSVKDCCTIYCEWLASALLPYNENNEDSKYQQLSKLVPVPIRKEPNRYARKMLSHLYNVFLPRQPINSSSISNSIGGGGGANSKDQSEALLTAVSRQAVLCHRVLRTIENIAQNMNNLMDNETWNHVLALLLTVNDKLLSAPTEPDDIGTQLQDRISGVLFELMLLACSRSIPDASLWKTFHEMCLNWRHRPALIDHWRRITLLLTKRIVQLPQQQQQSKQSDQQQLQQQLPTESIASNKTPAVESGNSAPTTLNIPLTSTNSNSYSSAIESAIASMSFESISQTWYRFLHLIGNPVELADPSVISRTDEFYHAACLANNVLDPRQHPCLNILPQIFMNSMMGLKDFIESFIGTYQQQQPTTMTTTLQNSTTRRSSSQEQQVSQQQQFKLNIDRPKCNAILHIFGDWLFSAALIGSDLNQETNPHQESLQDIDDVGGEGSCSSSVASASTTTEIEPPPINYSPAFARRQSHQSNASSTHSSSYLQAKRRPSKQQQQLQQQDNLSAFASEKITLDAPLSADSFESGQAESMAILCKIFSSKSASEDICPAYLARFYLCLQHCLAYGCGQDSKQPNQISGPIKRQLLASVLINSTTLLQKDLDGINLLIPAFVRAIEFIFECSEKEVPVQPPPRQHSRANSVRYGGGGSNSVNTTTNLANISNYDLRRACILTLVNLLAYPFHFQDLAIRNCLDVASTTTTFGSLRPRLLKLLFVALQTETDATNMQILFGGLSLAIHDLTRNKLSTDGDEQSSRRAASRRRGRGDTTPSSRGGGDSAPNSLLDSHHQQQSEPDTISQSSFVFNSNDGFLLKSLHVTCHLLINIWKHDNLVSLAALEVLTTIARVSASSALQSHQQQQQTAATKHEHESASAKKLTNNNNQIEMKSEYMQTTKWICDYICNQCSRPPPAHSRDMHSTIVAAYQCLSVWFYNHPYLLQNTSCVGTLMEVIELGVSGQKSKSTSVNPTIGIASQTSISKGEKPMKPSSMRVREAAESLLNICMVRTCQNGSKNIDMSDTVLNELDLAEAFGGPHHHQHSRALNQSRLVYQLEAYKLFKYFSDEDSIIFGFFEGSSHDPMTKDSAICLLRTPFGKHCWRMKFNYYSERSRDKIIANKTLGLIKRPFQHSATASIQSDNRIGFSFSKQQQQQNKSSLYFNNSARYFPETIENLPENSLDQLVTSLNDYCVNNQSSSVVRDERLKGDLDKIAKIITHQVLAEQKVLSDCSVRNKRIDCEEPQQMSDLEAARIMATHLGLKTALCPLTSGEKLSQEFVNNLNCLDNQPVRTCNSVNIFYVRKGRTAPMEILESVRQRHNVSLEFFEWLLELGQPVVIKDHNRWTGKVYSAHQQQSYHHHQLTNDSNHPSAHQLSSIGGGGAKETNEQTIANERLLIRNQMLMSDHGGSIFDGERMTLYWGDMCQELAFLVPHRLEKVCSNIMICWLECPDDLAQVPCDTLMSSPDQQTAEDAQAAVNSAVGGDVVGPTIDQQQLSNISTGSGHKFQSAAAASKSREFARYFISPMKNGLFRVNLTTSFGRKWLALPLVDGMTVSKGMLSSLIRESVLNLCRRWRLDADSYQPPHVKRRLKIQDLCANYKISERYESSEFYGNLLRSSKSAIKVET